MKERTGRCCRTTGYVCVMPFVQPFLTSRLYLSAERGNLAEVRLCYRLAALSEVICHFSPIFTWLLRQGWNNTEVTHSDWNVDATQTPTAWKWGTDSGETNRQENISDLFTLQWSWYIWWTTDEPNTKTQYKSAYCKDYFDEICYFVLFHCCESGIIFFQYYSLRDNIYIIYYSVSHNPVPSQYKLGSWLRSKYFRNCVTNIFHTGLFK